jgi:rod shape determining protein RodA
MREKSEGLFYNVDWLTVTIYLLLMMMGWFNIYSAVYDPVKSDVFNMERLESKQLLFAALSILLAFSILIIDASFFTVSAYALYGGVILLNLLVLVAGTEIKGSHSWFKIGGFTFQPGEFAKWATALALAKFMSGVNPANLKKSVWTALGIIGLPMAIIMVLQDETGVALVFASFMIVLYREGILPGWWLLVGMGTVLCVVLGIKYEENFLYYAGALVVLAVLSLLFIRRKFKNILIVTLGAIFFIGALFAGPKVLEKMPEHQAGRIKVWLGLPVSQAIEDRYGYNTRQSMIAIGSGGAMGKGYLEGTQTKFRFVPEQETDFIFCTVGEEWGFMGSALVVLLYTILIVRLVFMAERQRSDFTRIYGYAVAAVLFFHLVINVGMTIGIIPVIGIPLPFFSYGGSSLISFTILVFIFVKLDSQRLLVLR